MERIKHAIERAKAEGSPTARLVSPVVLAVDQAEPPPHPRDLKTPRPSEADARDEPITVQYAQTEVVSLDPSHLERERIISHQRTHPASWAFDVLRTKVLQKMDENGWRTLAITSPSVDSGKTVTAINLAMSIAQQDHRTALLVDFDFRRPSVASCLGLNRSPSLNEVLDGLADLGDALVNPGIERLVVLPTNQPMQGASEVLSSAKVTKLIHDVRERYRNRVVVFDLPPILSADDVMTVLPRMDCVLLVVASGTSTEKEVEEAMHRLGKANLLGIVLNKDEAPTQNAY